METEPVEIEGRAVFFARERRAVQWLRRNASDDILTSCSDVKMRAADVRNATPPGAKTKW